MKVDIRKSFMKDAEKLPASIQHELASIIALLEEATLLSAIANCKKMKGHKTAYRIRLGQYRIGFFFEKDTIELTRILFRKDIYKYFP